MFATLRRFALGLCIALSPLPAAAACQGRDLLATLPGPERAALEAAVAAQPFAVGNHWRATRGGSTIHVIGTFHMFDARMTMHMRKLMPDTPFDQLEVDMDKADRARKNYCVKHTGRVYGDSHNYDLTLCTSKLGIDKALEILLCAAKDI